MSLRDIIIMCVMPCGSRLSVRVCRPPLHQRRPAALRLTSGARVLYCVRRGREAVAVGTACVCLRLESSRSSTHNKQQMLLLSSPSHSSQSGDRVRGSAFPSLSLSLSLAKRFTEVRGKTTRSASTFPIFPVHAPLPPCLSCCRRAVSCRCSLTTPRMNTSEAARGKAVQATRERIRIICLPVLQPSPAILFPNDGCSASSFLSSFLSLPFSLTRSWISSSTVSLSSSSFIRLFSLPLSLSLTADWKQLTTGVGRRDPDG